MKLNFLAATVIGSSLVGCSHGSKLTVEQKQEPIPSVSAGYMQYSSGSVRMPLMKSEVLTNKMKLHFIKDEKLPRISYQILIGVGQSEEKPGIEGINAMTASLLDQGTRRYKALELADKLAVLGTEISIKPGSDFVMISVDALSIDAEELLGILEEVVLNPRFDKAEIERVRSQTIAILKRKLDNPGTMASQEFENWIYEGQSYGRDEMGTLESISRISQADIKKHYEKWYRPQFTSMAITGKFDSNLEQKVKATFAKWNSNEAQLQRQNKSQMVTKNEVKLVPKANLQQAEIRMGQPALPRGSSDFLILRLANEALGGSFGSRLNQVVRDDQGLTYSIYSFLDGRNQSGTFQIGTFTKNETTAKTIDETLKVFNKFVEDGITERELEAAKNQLAGQFPRAIETADRLASNILMLEFYGVPFDYLTNFNKNVRSFEVTQVNRAIKSNLKTNSLKILVYGNPQLAEQLTEIGK